MGSTPSLGICSLGRVPPTLSREVVVSCNARITVVRGLERVVPQSRCASATDGRNEFFLHKQFSPLLDQRFFHPVFGSLSPIFDKHLLFSLAAVIPVHRPLDGGGPSRSSIVSSGRPLGGSNGREPALYPRRLMPRSSDSPTEEPGSPLRISHSATRIPSLGERVGWISLGGGERDIESRQRRRSAFGIRSRADASQRAIVASVRSTCDRSRIHGTDAILPGTRAWERDPCRPTHAGASPTHPNHGRGEEGGRPRCRWRHRTAAVSPAEDEL